VLVDPFFVLFAWCLDSHKNGAAERKNRSIPNMKKNILRTKKMTKKFWVEALDCPI
jgi:hypothetical protein